MGVSSMQFFSGLVHSTLNRLCPALSLLQHNQGLKLPLELSLILPPTSPRNWELFRVVKHAFLDLCHKDHLMPSLRTVLSGMMLCILSSSRKSCLSEAVDRF